MISPGCSFKFVGLKETLIEINPQIQIRKVEHLKRNYRMTKAVLEVANAVLNKAKQHFPGQIEHAEPEIPMKDFGFKVSLASWSDAVAGKVSFGTQQAIVYAGEENESDLFKKLDSWTGKHPLIFSVLEAKGLEYDDVVVAFAKDNRSWSASSEVRWIGFDKCVNKHHLTSYLCCCRVWIFCGTVVSSMWVSGGSALRSTIMKGGY